MCLPGNLYKISCRLEITTVLISPCFFFFRAGPAEQKPVSNNKITLRYLLITAILVTNLKLILLIRLHKPWACSQVEQVIRRFAKSALGLNWKQYRRQ